MQVLDAPALQDDFYLNLVDWSSQNVLAVGLGSCVYLWSASTSKGLQSFLSAHLVYVVVLSASDAACCSECAPELPESILFSSACSCQIYDFRLVNPLYMSSEDIRTLVDRYSSAKQQRPIRGSGGCIYACPGDLLMRSACHYPPYETREFRASFMQCSEISAVGNAILELCPIGAFR